MGFSKEKTLEQLESYTKKKAAPLILGGIAFIESIFFPIPTDFFLIGYLIANEGREWKRIAAITILASVLGGIATYLIGFFAFSSVGVYIIEYLGLEETFTKVGTLFETHMYITLFAAAFTPIPYKAFALAAGFFDIPIVPFVLASLLGRGIRFGIEAYLLHRFGEPASRLLKKHFNMVTLLVVILIILFLVIF